MMKSYFFPPFAPGRGVGRDAGDDAMDKEEAADTAAAEDSKSSLAIC